MVVVTDKHKIPFQIDVEDYEAVSRYSWHISGGYVMHSVSCRNKIPLHTFLCGEAPTGLEWDHVNRDKLDNRRINLRLVTHRINSCNVGLRRNNTSGVTGVSKKDNGLWVAQIQCGQGVIAKYFKSKEEAIKARQGMVQQREASFQKRA